MIFIYIFGEHIAANNYPVLPIFECLNIADTYTIKQEQSEKQLTLPNTRNPCKTGEKIRIKIINAYRLVVCLIFSCRSLNH